MRQGWHQKLSRPFFMICPLSGLSFLLLAANEVVPLCGSPRAIVHSLSNCAGCDVEWAQYVHLPQHCHSTAGGAWEQPYHHISPAKPQTIHIYNHPQPISLSTRILCIICIHIQCYQKILNLPLSTNIACFPFFPFLCQNLHRSIPS